VKISGAELRKLHEIERRVPAHLGRAVIEAAKSGDVEAGKAALRAVGEWVAEDEKRAASVQLPIVSFMMLDYGQVQAPASVDEAVYRSGDPKRFTRSPKFEAYLRRQNARQEAFYKAGGDLNDFRAEEWS